MAVRFLSSENIDGTGVFTGNVTIGTSTTTPSVHYDNLVIEDVAGNNVGISLISGTGNNTALYFGDSADTDVGQLKYSHATNDMFFVTNAATALTIDSSQNSTFAGDVMPAAENAHNIGSAAVRWEDLYVDDGFIRDAYIDTNIYHNGNTDTYINFTTNTIKLATAGSFGFELDSNRDINSPDRLYMRQTQFGYSSAYKVVQFGNAAATSAISLGYNPSGNTNGGFSGNEILIPNNIRILAPNAADNQFYGVMMFSSNDKLLIGSSNYLIDSNYIMAMDPATQRVGIGTDSPTAKLEIVGSNGTNIFRGNFAGSADIFMGFDNANPYLTLQDNSNVTTHLFQSNVNNYIVGSNLGIGTTSPNRKLSVVKDTTITSGFNDISEFLDTTIGVGGSISLNVGRANSTKNLGKMAFKYAGSGSNDNAINWGFYDADNLMTLLANGNVGIGTTAFASTANLQLKLGNMGSGVVGEIFDAVSAADNSRIIICGGGAGTPQFSMRHYSAGYGIDMWLNTSSPWDTYIDNRNAASGFIFRNDCNDDGGEDELMRITGSGNVGIGTSSPSTPLQVHGQQKWYTTNADGNELRGFFNPGGAADDAELYLYKADGATQGVAWRGEGDSYIRVDSTSLQFINFYYGTTDVGQIVTGGTNVLYQSNSDYRLKENVVEMTGALDRVSQLKPSTYNFISQPETQVDGFMAHELQEVVPQAVSGEKDEMNEDGTPKYQGVDHSQIVPLLVGAIQELKQEIETLKAQIQ